MKLPHSMRYLKSIKRRNPGVEIINATVAGGGGSAARPVLQARLAGGSPPDTWQTHPGWELLGQYVEANYCEPITELYKSEGWDKVVPKTLIDVVTKDQKSYAVLVGVHRGNVLWYNKKLLQKHGVNVGDKMTMEEFFRSGGEAQSCRGYPACRRRFGHMGYLATIRKRAARKRWDLKVGKTSSVEKCLGKTPK